MATTRAQTLDVAGFMGGRVDKLVMGWCDIQMGFPPGLFIMFTLLLFGGSAQTIKAPGGRPFFASAVLAATACTPEVRSVPAESVTSARASESATPTEQPIRKRRHKAAHAQASGNTTGHDAGPTGAQQVTAGRVTFDAPAGWVPLDADLVVVLSGVVELALQLSGDAAQHLERRASRAARVVLGHRDSWLERQRHLARLWNIAVARRRPDFLLAKVGWVAADVSRDDLEGPFAGADMVGVLVKLLGARGLVDAVRLGDPLAPAADVRGVPLDLVHDGEVGAALVEAEALVKPLTHEQFNWKPSSEEWSVAECIEHLNKSGQAYEPAFEQALEKGGPGGAPPFRYGFFAVSDVSPWQSLAVVAAPSPRAQTLSMTESMTCRAHSSRATPSMGVPVFPGVPGRGTRTDSSWCLTIDSATL